VELYQVDEKLEYIAGDLRTARQNKQLSQRELSAKVGVPQAHISKIENGAVNLTIASLVDIGRALDLEVMLIPRKLIPAVTSLVRSAQTTPIADSPKLLRRLRKLLQPFETSLTLSDRERLNRTINELLAYRLGPNEIEAIRNMIGELRHKHTAPSDISSFTKALYSMRNRLAHHVPEQSTAIRPAYSLTGNDDA
jgi:transcriptional regulator with XRE-family HTH domain